MSLPTTTWPAMRRASSAERRLLLLGGEVDTGEEDLCDGRGGTAVRPGGAERLLEQSLEQVDRLAQAEMMRRGERAADVREKGAVVPHQREVRLRVAAVDGQHDPVAHRAAPATRRGSSASRRLEQRARELVLTDQRVRQERLARGDRVAGHRSLGGEPLVGGHVLDETEQLRRERRLRQRLRAGGTDPRRQLDDVVGLQPRDDAVVANVDDLHVAGAGRERRDQRRRGLAVEGTAALLEERRLLGDLGIAVDLEQPCLDLGDRCRARHTVALRREDGVVGVEVAEVGGRDRAELLEQAQREPRMLRASAAPCSSSSSGRMSPRRRARAAPRSGG